MFFQWLFYVDGLACGHIRIGESKERMDEMVNMLRSIHV